MVRTYRRKTDRCNISETAVQSAITDIIRNGISLREAAFNYNLSRSTLFDRLKRYKKNEEEMRDKIPTKMVCQSKYASRQIFNDKEEEELREYLIQCSSSHFGLSYKTTRKLAYDFAKQSEKKYPASWDLNRLAGDDWMYGFMKRNPQLSLRKPENTSLARSTAFNKKNVEIFFNNYKTIQQKYKFSPDRIINLDETGISTVLQAPRIIAECGKKQVGQVVTGERGTLVTFVGIITATGMSLPPVYIMPRKRIKEEYLFGAPPGSVCYGSQSGWMTSEIFLNVLQHIKRHLNCSNANPLLMIIDNHESHISLSSITFCRQNGIVMLSFPPHCTHRMQPLDVGVYGPFKSKLKITFNDYLTANVGSTIKIGHIPKLSSDAYLQSFTPKNIINSFANVGIWPLNSQIFADSDFLPAETLVYDEKISSKELRSDNLSVIDDILNDILARTIQIHLRNKIKIIDIRPLPKIHIETKTINRRGSSKVYTNTPEKDIIEEKERLKKMKQQKKNTVKKQVFTERKPIVENKKSKKRKSRNQSSSDSEELCNEYEKIAKEMQQDSDMDIDIAEVDYTDQVESMKIITGNYILAKFPTKKTIKYFVGKVLNVGENEYEVSFLRKSRNNGFVYPTVDDISNVMEMDIVMKLPEPLSHKGTSRTERLIKFGINLDHYNVS